MDYQDYSQQQSQQSQSSRNWPPHLLTPASQQSQNQNQNQNQQQLQPQQQGQFPSPISPGPYFFPGQSQPQQLQLGLPQTSPTNDSRPTTSALSLNLGALSVASPTTLSPIGPHQSQSGQLHHHQFHAHHPIPHQPHHAHSHSHSSGSVISPITPVSPQSISHISASSQFAYNFDDTTPSSGGLSPGSDPLLTQRRPSTGTHSASSELAVEKSVPRKRSLTNTLPVSQVSGLGHSLHQHSQSQSYTSSQTRQAGQHALPHPIITTTASSPPLPTSSASSPSSHPSHSHSHSLSHSHSHSSLSHSSFSQSHSPRPPQLEINANPASPYEEIDSAGASFGALGDDGSDDEFGSPSGSFSGGGSFGLNGSANSKASGSSGQQGQNALSKTIATNNFVTKLYQMINDSKSQHFITWTELGTSFVVSNVGEFSRSILGSHFKHNNFSSFVRQLNMYGFHKINRTPRAQRTSTSSQTWEFSHPKFLRARPDLLDAIKRKALEPDPRERNRVELPGEVARLLTDLREENRALWREVRSIGGRIPPQNSPATNFGPTIAANFGGPSQASQSQGGLGSGHGLTHSRSSSNLGADDIERDIDWEDEDGMNVAMSAGAMSGVGMVGSTQGSEDWDPHSRFTFGTNGGLGVPNFSFSSFGLGSTAGGGDEWRRWAEGEIAKERKRVEKLVGVVKALVDVAGRGGVGLGPSVGGGSSGMGMDREGDGAIPPSIIQELHEISLSFDVLPSPLSMPIPSPSPSPSPHSFARHPHSPNIFITSPTSPSPYPSSTHSRSPSRDSQTRSHPNMSHTNLPNLSIPNAVSGPSSQFPHSLHTPSSSPTTSDFPSPFFGQGTSHSRSVSSLSSHSHSHSHGHMPRQQPNITLTLETDDDGRLETKRQRIEGENDALSPDSLHSHGPGVGEDMDVIPNDVQVGVGVGEDVGLGSPVGTGAGTSKGTVVGLRGRSDSAPMWGGGGGSGGVGSEGGSPGGLSANWTGRGRSASSFGQ